MTATSQRQMIHGPDAMHQLQSLPLEDKVHMSRERIRQFYEAMDGAVSVSVSGGQDSTVLADLVALDYPDVPRVFFDTGLEYPENREQARHLKAIFLKPTMAFPAVIEKHGYPIISKRVAQYVREARETKSDGLRRLRLTGIRKDGTYSKLSTISKCWQFLANAPFKISERCCDCLKKRPGHAYEKETGNATIIGVRAEEGQQRELSWRRYGCNSMEANHRRSWPMAFWTDEDVREYIKTRGLRYSALYDMGYRRSGCMFCMFGIHLEPHPNRFDLMRVTHPKQYVYCMDKLGIGRVLDYVFKCSLFTTTGGGSTPR